MLVTQGVDLLFCVGYAGCFGLLISYLMYSGCVGSSFGVFGWEHTGRIGTVFTVLLIVDNSLWVQGH